MRKSVDTFTILLPILVILVAAKVGMTQQGEGDVMWQKVDEYSNTSWREERARLKEFSARLRAERDATAYIVAFGGRVSCPSEAQLRAARVKSYLAKVEHIQSARIKTIDAGHQERWLMSLYVAPPDAPPITVEMARIGYFIFDPSKVQERKSCKAVLSRQQHSVRPIQLRNSP